MKLKTLLNTMVDVNYAILTESGWALEEGYISKRGYAGESYYEDCKVLKVTTVQRTDIIFITVKQ